MRMVATDLDGTLIRSDGRIAARDLETLRTLGERGVVRVVATGRSLRSARQAIARDLPLDYLAFSSGAGLLDWRTGALIGAWGLDAHQTERAAAALIAMGIDFMVQDPIPGDHRFAYLKATGADNPDFDRRIARHRDHATPGAAPFDRPACHLVAVVADDPTASDRVARALPDLTVLRTTSPVDGASVWIEVFPGHVSKSQGTARLAARHGIAAGEVVAVGNDTNDADLLAWAGRGYVVANAPLQLRQRFPTVASHDDAGFSEAVHRSM